MAYGVLGSTDMKDMAKELQDFMKLWAHWHVFCSALQFASGTRLSLWNKRKREAVSRTIPARGSESK